MEVMAAGVSVVIIQKAEWEEEMWGQEALCFQGRSETLRQSYGLVGGALADNVEGTTGEGLGQSARRFVMLCKVLIGNEFFLHC